MSCTTCKSKSKESNQIPETVSNNKNYVVKFIVFLIASVILIPVIIPILIVALFKVIVLGHSVDITPLLRYLGRKIFPKDEEEEEDDEDLNEDDYELENPHDIIQFKPH